MLVERQIVRGESVEIRPLAFEAAAAAAAAAADLTRYRNAPRAPYPDGGEPVILPG
jgi:hypothetical protein